MRNYASETAPVSRLTVNAVAIKLATIK